MMQSSGWSLRNWPRRWTPRPRVGGEMRRIFFALLILAVAQRASAQDWAKEKLAKSPRHSEWVSVKHDGRSVETFIVYPESKDKKPVVLLIHDRAGLTDWFKTLADQVAAMGYVALAPDVSSDPGLTAQLNAVADYGKKLSASNGTLFVAGIGWGGEQSFRFAADRSDVAAALVICGGVDGTWPPGTAALCPSRP